MFVSEMQFDQHRPYVGLVLKDRAINERSDIQGQ